MKLIRHNPAQLGRVTDFDEWLRFPFSGFPAFNQLLNLGDFFNEAGTGKLAVDIHEDANNYYAQFELPGVKKEDIKIELHDRMLSVVAEKRQKTAEGEQSFSLSRSVSVPDGVNSEGIAAKLEDGMLTVTLPKLEQRKPKVIEVA